MINKVDRCGVYHRDIKPSNIVVNHHDSTGNYGDSLDVVLIDFGMSGIANFESYKTRTSCGSAHFMAPEMKLGQKYD